MACGRVLGADGGAGTRALVGDDEAVAIVRAEVEVSMKSTRAIFRLAYAVTRGR